MTKKDFDFQAARTELDALLAWFEGDDVAIDEALVKYEQAQKLVAELEAYLGDKKAEIELLTKKTAA